MGNKQNRFDFLRIPNNSVEKDVLAFSPASLEIQQTPPHPLGRVTAWLILILVVVALIWAMIGEMDIVAVAEGKIIPAGQVKEIQSFDKGLVSKIFVREGQVVKAGEQLIALDPTITKADKDRLEKEISQNRLHTARLKAFLDVFDEVETKNSSIREHLFSAYDINTLSQEDINFHQLLLDSQINGFVADKQKLFSQKTEIKAELESNKAQIEKLSNTLPLVNERLSALQQLSDQKMVGRLKVAELEQERIELVNNLNSAKAEQSRIQAKKQEIIFVQDAFISNARIEAMEQLATLEREYKGLLEELKKARQLNEKRLLTAPVDGVVQELRVHTIGGVVTSAEPLMKIVPKNRELIVEAWMENKDIGFINPGQEAEIKVHTFPFTKYGLINAKVDAISSDATAHEEKGLVYKTRLLLESNRIQINERWVDLMPGMGVSAEIKTGKRRLIEYVLSPLIRYGKESVRER